MAMTPWNFVNTNTMSAVDLQLQNEAPSYGSRWVWACSCAWLLFWVLRYSKSVLLLHWVWNKMWYIGHNSGMRTPCLLIREPELRLQWYWNRRRMRWRSHIYVKLDSINGVLCIFLISTVKRGFGGNLESCLQENAPSSRPFNRRGKLNKLWIEFSDFVRW